ncbi:TAP-like protein-domain-containing protein [Mycena metata]|uniref:TAP-like protein-domain-containing protein n=1 Tax=Mycena metata TaxID=1033252 RepID=A0AAD7HZW0_9AGAR|nr:TAP-like protein-domain-containing protein [Mycena metata]
MAFFTGSSKIFAVIAVFSSLQALADTNFRWNKLEASDKLVWTPCYSGLQCSLLQVPLDYSSATAGTVSIAIARYPANCTKSEYLGPILLNDGGPGGSGVDYVVEVGASIATIIGKQFDIVGFDPRALNQTADAVAQQWVRAQILGQLAVNRNDGNLHSTYYHRQHCQRYAPHHRGVWVREGAILGCLDKVGRVVVDGVMPMDTWYSAVHIANLTREAADTDKALQTFFDGCAAAGPEACAFSAPSSIEVAAKLDALFAAIEIQPVPVITPVSYGVVDYTFLRNSVFHALYSPYDSFVALAQGLADLAMANATTLYTAEEVPPFECDFNSTTPFHENGYEALVAISCGDMAIESDTVSQLQAYYASIQAISTIADLYGPFGALNTSFPLLVIGNTADPVTPIAGAKSTVDAFPGSALLTIDAPGHTSLGAPSTCFYGYLRQYFQNGTLPPQGTVCQPDGVLFPPPANAITEGVAPRGLDAWEAELIEASHAIGKATHRAMARRLSLAV